jgi:hypothetical protein
MTPTGIQRLLEEIAVAEDEAEVTALLERYADQFDALPPEIRERANELIENALCDRITSFQQALEKQDPRCHGGLQSQPLIEGDSHEHLTASRRQSQRRTA